MIPQRAVEYLEQHRISYQRRSHPLAISGQELAHSLGVTGYRVAKAVVVEVDGNNWIAVLPAAEVVDQQRLAETLGARSVRLVGEDTLQRLFPDCELGAEPPFGGLYQLPVVLDSRLAGEHSILVRAGSHTEVLELGYQDFLALENPRVASFAVRSLEQAHRHATPEARA